MSDRIRRGNEFPPCSWLHAAADGRVLVLFACVLVLVPFHRHLDTTGGSIKAPFVLSPRDEWSSTSWQAVPTHVLLGGRA